MNFCGSLFEQATAFRHGKMDGCVDFDRERLMGWKGSAEGDQRLIEIRIKEIQRDEI